MAAGTLTPETLDVQAQVFEAVLREILSGFELEEDAGQATRDGMEAGMRKLFEQPYEREFAALQSAAASFGADDARQALFHPSLTDMQLYVEAFGRATPDVDQAAPESTARRKRVMKFKMASVFYTLHRQDAVLMDRFIHYGGLSALASLLGESNRVIQSQAVELLMEMLSPLMELKPTTASRVAHLQHQVFRCVTSKSYWSNLASVVAEPHEVFPQSHANCVRLIAGAIGWLRPQDAGAKAEVGAQIPAFDLAKRALESFLECRTIQKMPDVHGLAEELLLELSESIVIRADPLSGQQLQGLEEKLFAAEAECAAHSWQRLRRLGNAAFKRGQLWPAEAAYRMALSRGGAVVPSQEASLIQSNRALVLLKSGHPRAAAAAAALALQSDPRNGKAAFRRAKALLELRDASDSLAGPADAREALEAATLACELEPGDVQVKGVLESARQWEQAAAVSAAASHTEPDYAVEACLDSLD